MRQETAKVLDHPCVFLSYGRRDTQPLAERLHADLTARGYEIWQDIQCIRTGWAWDEEIRTALRSSHVLLAMLSPHSVRRSGAPGNPDNKDSVCLDEIAYARGACGLPIVPVKVMPCETPFLICHLQQVDFQRWHESDAEYRAGLENLRPHSRRPAQ